MRQTGSLSSVPIQQLCYHLTLGDLDFFSQLRQQVLPAKSTSLKLILHLDNLKKMPHQPPEHQNQLLSVFQLACTVPTTTRMAPVHVRRTQLIRFGSTWNSRTAPPASASSRAKPRPREAPSMDESETTVRLPRRDFRPMVAARPRQLPVARSAIARTYSPPDRDLSPIRCETAAPTPRETLAALCTVRG